jgi:ATP-dependent DNA helicase RecQ
LKLTESAIDILKGQKNVEIKSSRLELSSKEKIVKRAEDFSYDDALFESLRTKRAELAKELGIPAYLIFSDKTLKHLASDKPHDKASMLEVNGVGEKKFEQYGEEFLEVIN